MAEKNILAYLSSVLNGHSRAVEGESYKSIFGGTIVIDAEKFPMMTTQRVHLYDIVEALNYKLMPLAVSSLLECPFTMTTVECATRYFTMQLYVMDNVLYAQVSKYLTFTDDFHNDLARMALCHRAIAKKLRLKHGPLKIIFGEVRMPATDQKRLQNQFKKKCRLFPELSFKSTSATLDARHIMVSGYYPID